jgi:hypothetical protein
LFLEPISSSEDVFQAGLFGGTFFGNNFFNSLSSIFSFDSLFILTIAVFLVHMFVIISNAKPIMKYLWSGNYLMSNVQEQNLKILNFFREENNDHNNDKNNNFNQKNETNIPTAENSKPLYQTQQGVYTPVPYQDSTFDETVSKNLQNSSQNSSQIIEPHFFVLGNIQKNYHFDFVFWSQLYNNFSFQPNILIPIHFSHVLSRGHTTIESFIKKPYEIAYRWVKNPQNIDYKIPPNLLQNISENDPRNDSRNDPRSDPRNDPQNKNNIFENLLSESHTDDHSTLINKSKSRYNRDDERQPLIGGADNNKNTQNNNIHNETKNNPKNHQINSQNSLKPTTTSTHPTALFTYGNNNENTLYQPTDYGSFSSLSDDFSLNIDSNNLHPNFDPQKNHFHPKKIPAPNLDQNLDHTSPQNPDLAQSTSFDSFVSETPSNQLDLAFDNQFVLFYIVIACLLLLIIYFFRTAMLAIIIIVFLYYSTLSMHQMLFLWCIELLTQPIMLFHNDSNIIAKNNKYYFEHIDEKQNREQSREQNREQTIPPIFQNSAHTFPFNPIHRLFSSMYISLILLLRRCYTSYIYVTKDPFKRTNISSLSDFDQATFQFLSTNFSLPDFTKNHILELFINVKSYIRVYYHVYVVEFFTLAPGELESKRGMGQIGLNQNNTQNTTFSQPNFGIDPLTPVSRELVEQQNYQISNNNQNIPKINQNNNTLQINLKRDKNNTFPFSNLSPKPTPATSPHQFVSLTDGINDDVLSPINSYQLTAPTQTTQNHQNDQTIAINNDHYPHNSRNITTSQFLNPFPNPLTKFNLLSFLCLSISLFISTLWFILLISSIISHLGHNLYTMKLSYASLTPSGRLSNTDIFSQFILTPFHSPRQQYLFALLQILLCGAIILNTARAMLKLNTFSTCLYFLIGLTVYDVFWVYLSPYIFGTSVMVEVATGTNSNTALTKKMAKKLFTRLTTFSHLEQFHQITSSSSLLESLNGIPSYLADLLPDGSTIVGFESGRGLIDSLSTVNVISLIIQSLQIPMLLRFPRVSILNMIGVFVDFIGKLTVRPFFDIIFHKRLFFSSILMKAFPFWGALGDALTHDWFKRLPSGGNQPESILGLGDIIIPAMFLAFIYSKQFKLEKFQFEKNFKHSQQSTLTNLDQNSHITTNQLSFDTTPSNITTNSSHQNEYPIYPLQEHICHHFTPRSLAGDLPNYPTPTLGSSITIVGYFSNSNNEIVDIEGELDVIENTQNNTQNGLVTPSDLNWQNCTCSYGGPIMSLLAVLLPSFPCVQAYCPLHKFVKRFPTSSPLQPRQTTKLYLSYYSISLWAYLLALLLCEFVAKTSGRGQPALFFIVPMVLGAVTYTAHCRDETEWLWGE